jgi:enediyne biosynthesis protein E5
MTVRFPADARVFQILFLGSFLGIGALLRDFAIRPEQVAATFLVAILVQGIGNAATGAGDAGLKSACVTALGLSLLLRSSEAWVHPAAAAIAIGAKFVVRVRGKHLFNPANLGVIVALVAFPGSWVSAGQWGHDVALAGWILVLGLAVVARATRSDTSLAFLAIWLGAIGVRVLWLGQSGAVFLHQLESGALLLFTFFMISDPKTTPDRRSARILHAAVVAALAFEWQFGLFRPNALLWALFLASPLVPVLDALLPGRAFQWIPKGGSEHALTASVESLARAPARVGSARRRRALARGTA